jgi:hypothetical protein
MHRSPKTAPHTSPRSFQSATTVWDYPQMGVIFRNREQIIQNHRHIVTGVMPPERLGRIYRAEVFD